MTTIQRLGIQGIRSYGPDQEQSIVFTPPLTLIVGSNGCGKTTVIEVSITPGAPVKASWGSCNTRWCGVHTVSWRV
jgi:predicted ATPase